LSKPYKISFKVLDVKGNPSKKLQVYVDNNTTGMANSPHGGASRLYSMELSSIKAGSTVEIQGSVGTANSFIQLRVESEGTVVIDDLVIESIYKKGGRTSLLRYKFHNDKTVLADS